MAANQPSADTWLDRTAKAWHLSVAVVACIFSAGVAWATTDARLQSLEESRRADIASRTEERREWTNDLKEIKRDLALSREQLARVEAKLEK